LVQGASIPMRKDAFPFYLLPFLLRALILSFGL
jgi:hypothetical protein